MQIDFEKEELNVLNFYMNKTKIDVEGLAAIGVTSKETVKTINRVLKKLEKARRRK